MACTSLPIVPAIHIALAAEHKVEVVEGGIHLRHIDIVDHAVDNITIVIMVIDHWRHLLERSIFSTPETVSIELLVSSSRICRIGLLLHSAKDIIRRLGSIIDIPACERQITRFDTSITITIIKGNFCRSAGLAGAHLPQIIGLAIILRRCGQFLTRPMFGCRVLRFIIIIYPSANLTPSGRLLDIAERAVVIRKGNRRR